jgi:hypothetical protein
VSVPKGKDSAPLIFGHPAPGLDRQILRHHPRGRGRPPKIDAARVVHRLHARGLLPHRIAVDPVVQRFLGGRVTAARICQILKVDRRDGLQRDFDDVEGWARGIEPSWWTEHLFPWLLAHPDLWEGRPQRFTRSRGKVGEPSSEPWRALSWNQWRERNPDVAVAEERARRLSKGAWRVTVRALILRHLWERSNHSGLSVGRRLHDLAERVAQSERQVRRVVLERRRGGAAP